MVKLRANFANADGALFPNEFVNVHLLVNTLTNATWCRARRCSPARREAMCMS